MENIVDSYLHKKFKKQLSIEPRPQAFDKENKDEVRTADHNINKHQRTPVSAENSRQIETTTITTTTCRPDNTPLVPNTSTNKAYYCSRNVTSESSSSSATTSTKKYDGSSSVRYDVVENNDKSLNVSSKSSISLENPVVNLQQSHNNISYVPNIIHRYEVVNFDTKFSSSEVVSSNTHGPKSSILDTNNLYNNYNDAKPNENAPALMVDHAERHQENERKLELEVPTQPDRGAGGGKYVCTYCNLACSKPSVLQKHIRAHTNERPYPCVSCGFSFKTRSNLYKHCRSRTHANRVLGSRARGELVNDEQEPNSFEASPRSDASSISEFPENQVDYKSKVYKPRFHTKSYHYEQISKENIEEENNKTNHHANSDILSHHISELISKNNSKQQHQIITNETYLSKRIINPEDNYSNSSEYANVPQRIIVREQQDNLNIMKVADEPLNLTNKGRKRCISEAGESKSLIKELLLKNLSSDMQCPHCKMIFQTVTELELHKLRSCKGFVKPGAKYTRSSSVNVASILTQNKNAFDGIPQMQQIFPLKSPGPFLGNTRLVDSDKSKSFSFDDGLPNIAMYHPKAKEMITSKYLNLNNLNCGESLSLEKKAPVKLFGGELKITENAGNSEGFNIAKSDGCGFEANSSFMNYGGKISENRVIRSGLHSGGTVLTNNKGNFNSNNSAMMSQSAQNVIKVYDSGNNAVSPGIMDVGRKNKSSFSFENNTAEIVDRKKPPDLVIHSSNEDLMTTLNNNVSSPSSFNMKYTNIIDFSQNAVKLLTPNLKQPNLMVPGLPVPNKFTYSTPENTIVQPLKIDVDVDSLNNPQNLTNKPGFKEKTITPSDNNSRYPLYDDSKFQFPPQDVVESQQRSIHDNIYNPVNILVNGKVIRYVPGMPGPVVAEAPPEVAYVMRATTTTLTNTNNVKVSPSQRRVIINNNNTMVAPTIQIMEEKERSLEEVRTLASPSLPRLNKPQSVFDSLEVKTTDCSRSLESRHSPKAEMRSPVIKLMNEMKSPVKVAAVEHQQTKRFARPNSLALKPTSASLKQHHGLTPTMFNQILISPDTPRVAKKYVQQYLNGNYFSYLGLKSTTKPVYCTLNKTQPFYVPHFKKLSMYSEWRQQDTKTDKLFVAGYDSRQKSSRFAVAGQKSCDLIVHSSYKFTSPERSKEKDEAHKSSSILGGFESNDDYTYIRGRGRGRYVCEQCGIRCKKPSMLKKHIRTHSNDRPYTCSHCNFSFKTKGNLTKHMKSKAHNKNSTSGSSSSSNQRSGTPSSESETEDSGMDSSDESTTRQQEHEAAYGLLSLSQKSTHNLTPSNNSNKMLFSAISSTTNQLIMSDQSSNNNRVKLEIPNRLMNTEEIAYVTKTNFAKNKFLEQPTVLKLRSIKEMAVTTTNVPDDDNGKEEENDRNVIVMTEALGKCNGNRPLTYPYYNMSEVAPSEEAMSVSSENTDVSSRFEVRTPDSDTAKSIKQFHVIQKYASGDKEYKLEGAASASASRDFNNLSNESQSLDAAYSEDNRLMSSGQYREKVERNNIIVTQNLMIVPNHAKQQVPSQLTGENYSVYNNNEALLDARKRKLLMAEEYDYSSPKLHKNDEVMDLSVSNNTIPRTNAPNNNDGSVNLKINGAHPAIYQDPEQTSPLHFQKNNNGSIILPLQAQSTTLLDEDSRSADRPPSRKTDSPKPLVGGAVIAVAATTTTSGEFDNSAMETLAEIATKQVKLEKNAMAKSVASEYLKLTTKQEFPAGEGEERYVINVRKEVNDLLVKPEGSKSCSICGKSFVKLSQLRLHMNVHYLERPFRCNSCSVSFRTKGHLQKHERSAGHHNKLSSSPATSSSEPRPFKCADCNIAFRIHGHLAKHLRSKMHIMKLECLAKIPFGLYAELERSNSLLTEINTTDGDQCLESLKTLAKKVFLNDPGKLKTIGEPPELVEAD